MYEVVESPENAIYTKPDGVPGERLCDSSLVERRGLITPITTKPRSYFSGWTI